MKKWQEDILKMNIPQTGIFKKINMKAHTKIYLEYFDYGNHQDVFIPCEVCKSRAVDIHHIDPRGTGGDPNASKDTIENLAALCRICHKKAEHSIPYNEYIKNNHLSFIKAHKR